MLMFLIYVKDSHVRWWHDSETWKDEGHKHYFDKTFIIISSFDICTKIKILKKRPFIFVAKSSQQSK